MEPIIEVVEPKLFASTVADEIVASIDDAISEHGSCSLVLSGGSTPGVVYRCLSRPPRVSEIDWEKVRIYWGDDRHVPHDDPKSNYRMANETLLSHLPSPGPKVIPVDSSFATPAESAKAYARAIRESENISDQEVPNFDIVLLGLGKDGHFASVFPESPYIQDDIHSAVPEICVEAKNPEDDSLRVSITPKTLFSARKVLFIVMGNGKAEIVQQVLEGNESAADIPALLAKQATGRLNWFLDSAAGQNLSRKGD